MEEREHKNFSPSKAERFFRCPGSYNLISRLGQRTVTTSYALEGQKAHKILEIAINCGVERAKDVLPFCDTDIKETDYEFLSAIDDALAYIFNLIDEVRALDPDVMIATEMFVDPPLSVAPGEGGGHLDVALWSIALGRIWVIDYKHGAGVAKAVEGNEQTMQYGAGLMTYLYKEQDIPLSHWRDVTLVILQPRAYHPDGEFRSYTVPTQTIFTYLTELEYAVTKCLDPTAPLVPGEVQCRFCEAAALCPARETMTVALINPECKTVQDLTIAKLPDLANMDLVRLSHLKFAFPLINSWMSAVNSQVDNLLRAGLNIPGWKLVETSPRRHWHGQEDERISKLADLMGCLTTDLYSIEPKSVTAVETMMKDAFKSRVSRTHRNKAAHEANQLFAYFTTKESSGNLTVVEQDDVRPAVKLADSFAVISAHITPPPTRGE